MSDPHDVTSQQAISESHAAHDAQLTVEAHEEHPHVNYMMVFAALIAFTVISYVADKIGGERGSPLKTFVVLIVLVVASFKAAAVMLYFMHLKFERLWKYALLAPTIILALALIVSLMPDIAGDYYARVIPQTDAATAEHHASGTPAVGAGDAEHATPTKTEAHEKKDAHEHKAPEVKASKHEKPDADHKPAPKKKPTRPAEKAEKSE